MSSTATDDVQASSATLWDSDEQTRLRVSPNQAADLQASPHNLSISPLPRSSTDSESRPAVLTPFSEGGNPLERRDTLATIHSVEQPTLVEPGFDESVLRQLCDLDVRPV